MQTQSRATTRGAAARGWPATWAARPSGAGTRSRKLSAGTYEWLTGNDVARELARIDLPLSTYTQWYWKIDLHNLLHFLTLRVDPHAQWEIQEFGRVMAGMLKRVAPLSYEAWIDYDVCGAPLSRMELDVLRSLVSAHRRGRRCSRRAAPKTRADLLAAGLSTREADELLLKLKPRPTPDFELDLSRARPPEYLRRTLRAGRARRATARLRANPDSDSEHRTLTLTLSACGGRGQTGSEDSGRDTAQRAVAPSPASGRG